MLCSDIARQFEIGLPIATSAIKEPLSCAASSRLCPAGTESRLTACSAAARRLVHRGPDAQTVWTAPHGRAGLGHARLSIIDLATGDQPIANEDESLHIVVNGEFYDFEAIRRELQERRACVPDAVGQRDRACICTRTRRTRLHQLRGEFAFALWDERDGAAVRRHATGSASSRSTTRSSTARVTWRRRSRRSQALGVPIRWDRESLFDIHYGLMHAPSRTTFDGIFQVPPGCYLLTDGVHVHVHPYWDFNYPPADVTQAPCDPQEAVERLRATHVRGRAAAAARRRARRVLPERRARLVLGARHRVRHRDAIRCAPTRSRSTWPTTTSGRSPRRKREAVGRRVPPDSDSSRTSSRTISPTRSITPSVRS